ncbi:MAG: hypothetical protein M4579_006302 [Chaenotheca gracillima]|nr:MAG: hypothetical protein M4579_006302 [Chaenotheca gracillima]
MSQSWDYIAKLVCIGDSGTGKSSLTIRLCEGRFSPHHDVTIGVEFGSRIVPVGPPNNLTTTDSTPTETTQPTTSPSSPPPSKATTTTKSKSPAPKSSKQSTLSHSQKQKFMKLSLWDTAGQETYKSVTRSYFRGASGALLVFDITRRDTFTHVTDWLRDLRQIAEPDIVVVLVGNKADLTPAESADADEDDEGEDGAEVDGDGEPGGAEIPTADPPKKMNGHGATGTGAGGRARAVTRAEARRWCATNDVLTYVETSAKSGEGVERAFQEVSERIWQNIEAGRYDLNDRRSGVKGASAGGAGNTARTVNLGLNDAAAGGRGSGGGSWGGCC